MARNAPMARQIVRDFGTCLLFNGTSAKVASSVWSSAINTISMGAWFKTRNYRQNRQPIVSNGNGDVGGGGYALVVSGDTSTDGSLYLLNHNTAWISLGAKVQDDKWHHIILTIDASDNTKVYLDGVQIFSAGSQTLGNPATNSYVGTDNTASGWFNGFIDEVRFYTRALSATEVTDLFYGIEPSSTSFANWYKYDEGSGTSATDSKGSATGTITAATYSTAVFMKPRNAATGRYGNSLGLAFKPVNNGKGTISSNSSLNPNGTALTMEAWIFFQSGNSTPTIIKKDNQYILRLTSSTGALVLILWTSDFAARSTADVSNLVRNKWNHVAATYDGANVNLWVNGVNTKTQAQTGTLSTGASAMTLGSDSGGSEYFVGLIDEVRLSDVVRYTGAFTPQTTPFIPDANTRFLYHMDTESTTTLTDSSSNANNLTLSGAFGFQDGIVQRVGQPSRSAA